MLPGLIGHQYAKFAPWYENKIDFAILKSTEFDLKSTKFAEPKDADGRKLFWGISRNVRTGRSYFGKLWTDGQKISEISGEISEKISRILDKIDQIW